MRLKAPSTWTGNFKYFLTDLSRAVLYDSEMTEPVVFGNKSLVDIFITKHIPRSSVIEYYSRKSVVKSWNGISFAMDYIYEGIEKALEGESEQTTQKHN